MEALARFVIAHRRAVISVWIFLALVGGFAAGQVADRFSQEFSIPGQPAYEANQRAFEAFGNGRNYPVQLVYHAEEGDIRGNAGVQESIEAITTQLKGSRSTSFFDTGADYFVSKDGATTYATLYGPGLPTFGGDANLPIIEKILAETTPEGVESHLTGYSPIYLSQGGETGPTILQEVLIGGVGALVVLLLVFGTVPAVLMPLMIAAVSIMVTYLAVWGLTYLTDVSIIVQFLIGLVGLGIAIDYALLVIFRYREELGQGKAPHDALIETMTHAGHSVIVSGSTVGIGLVSMILLPVPFIRAIGLGGLLIPVVSVLATVTLLPAVLSLMGTGINRWRIPILWRLANLDDHHGGRFWPAWARLVVRRPWPVFLVGAILVGIIISPAIDINPANAPLANEPASGSAESGRRQLERAGFGQGTFEPIEIILEKGASDADVAKVVAAAEGVDDVVGVVAPEAWIAKGMRIVQVQQRDDAAVDSTTDVIDGLRGEMRELDLSGDTRVTVAGAPAEDRDFVHAVYDNFPLMMAFVIGLTFLLLARALRSIVLPLKAVVLNLVSLGAAYGVITFVFQQGHGSDAIWGYAASGAIIAWIPLMIFAFLFGISMDYEVFMLTRIREAYDAGHDTPEAVVIGLTRTAKLVTAGAAILMFTFVVLSTGPGPDIKQFAIGLAAGIVIDATIIRVMLVPATVKLLGRANWWFPEWARKALLLPVAPPRGVLPDATAASSGVETDPEPELVGTR
ncbi:MAG: conserved rane protein of unknown function [Thermoleophilia bacterium]|nr:conserved rane protein of unknown function [Thermoleophilia bacterium]